MFVDCHSFGEVIARIEWPSAGSLVEQENCVVEIFSVIKNELYKVRQSKQGK